MIIHFTRPVYIYIYCVYITCVLLPAPRDHPPQEGEDNRKRLDDWFGGTVGLAKGLRVDLSFGLATGQIEVLREAYGPNSFPEIPMKSFCTLFVESFNDTILLVLIAAAIVSLIIGMVEHPAEVRQGERGRGAGGGVVAHFCSKDEQWSSKVDQPTNQHAENDHLSILVYGMYLFSS